MASPTKWSTQILHRPANVKTSTDKSERNEAIDKLDWRLLADVNNTNKNIAGGNWVDTKIIASASEYSY